MEVIISHLTRMASPHICVAGVDVETEEHIRPVLRHGRLTTSDLRAYGGPFEMGARVDLGAVVDVGRPPELEDRQFGQARHAGVMHDAEFWELLGRVSRSTLGEIFGSHLGPDAPGRTIPVGRGTASLGCLRPGHTPRLYLSPDGRLRLWLFDADVELNLSVTDIRLYEQDLRTPAVARVNDVARRLRRGVGVLLSVGVGRPYPPDEPRHWLQVNNMHLADAPVSLAVA